MRFGIDFKHAVEFSSFGCVPGLNLSIPAGGNSDYFSEVFRQCQIGEIPSILPSPPACQSSYESLDSHR